MLTRGPVQQEGYSAVCTRGVSFVFPDPIFVVDFLLRSVSTAGRTSKGLTKDPSPNIWGLSLEGGLLIP